MQHKHILISNGRSGSAFINEKIATIFNVEYHKHVGIELYGSNYNKLLKTKNPVKMSKQFFNKYPNIKHIGFQWKPYILNKTYLKVLPYIKTNNIKVLINKRNWLDVILSESKRVNNDIKSHYKSNNKQFQKALNIRVTLNASTIISQLVAREKRYAEVIVLLKNNNINYLEIFYDTLKKKKQRDWIKIIKFLDPSIDINRKYKTKLRETLKNDRFKKTTIMKHYEIITNYDDILNALIGTEYEKYIDIKSN